MQHLKRVLLITVLLSTILLSRSPVLSQTIILPPVDPSTVTGNLDTAGSSTVFPVMAYAVQQFENAGYTGNISVNSIGTGSGFQRFCVDADIDIANADREITELEAAECLALAEPRDPISFLIGYDAITVFVNESNTFVESLTLEQLALVFSTAETWQDVNGAWPDEPIIRSAPGTDSGIFDFFVEVVFNSDPQPVEDASNIQFYEDDNALVNRVVQNAYGVGFVSTFFAQNTNADLKAIPVTGNPLEKPLLLYTTAGIMTDKPQVADFLNYVLTNVVDFVAYAGYLAPSAEEIDAARQLWLDVTGETAITPTPTATTDPGATLTPTPTATTDPGATLTPTATSTTVLPTIDIEVTIPATGYAVPSVSWENMGADWHQIVIGLVQEGFNVVELWVPSPDICSGNTCTYTPDALTLPFGLGEGAHNVTVNAWRWTNQAANEGLFSVVGSTQITVGVRGLVDASSGRPVITFDDGSTFEWFNVFVGTPDFSRTVDFNWYSVNFEVECDGTTCTLIPNANPENGSYVVYLQGWDGSSVSAWSGPFRFSLDFDTATPIEAMTTTQNGDSATYTWVNDGSATWYQTYIGSQVSGVYETFYIQWNNTFDLGCAGGGTCSITPSVEYVQYVPSTTYEIWTQAYGPGGIDTSAGFGGWVQSGTFVPTG